MEQKRGWNMRREEEGKREEKKNTNLGYVLHINRESMDPFSSNGTQRSGSR